MIRGIFTSEKQALGEFYNNDADDTWFIAPTLCDEPIKMSFEKWPGMYFPLADISEDVLV